MIREMCKSKIHRATVTEINADYSGSIMVDKDLMDSADIITYEKVLVANITNGERFETYVIPAPAGSGKVAVLGGAARLASAGDKIIIMSFVLLEDKEAKNHRQLLILVDEKNKPVK